MVLSWHTADDFDTTNPADVAWEIAVAMDNDELWMAFQPQVDVRTHRLVGMEALIRWDHPLYGSVSPAVFMAAVESDPIMVTLGRWIVRRACAQFAEWVECYDPDRRVRLSINLVAYQLDEPEFAQYLDTQVREAKLRPDQVRFELVERQPVSGMVAMDNLAQLIDMDYHISLDDFGCDYSNMDLLSRVPAREVKIDRSFISQVVEHDRIGRMVHTMCGMAKQLRIDLVVEGIEHHDQLARCIDLGVEIAQGAYWSMPVPIENINIDLDGVLAAAATAGRSFGAPCVPCG